MNISKTIAKELNVREQQITATIALLDEGATVPFIARYRKEVTAGLDDTQLRLLEEKLSYLRELEDRRKTVLESIESQEKLTPELKAQILAADNKSRLEDLYLPYKPKRRTKAQIAKEAGLEPLADALLQHPELTPENEAAGYLNPDKEIKDTDAALTGALHILLERFAEDADLVSELREHTWENALMCSAVKKDQEQAGAKFKDYFEFNEKLNKIPSHRILAILRGEKEGFLRSKFEFDGDSEEQFCLSRIAKAFNIQQKNRAADAWLWKVVEWTWKVKLKTRIDLDLLTSLRESAEAEAINVFKDNLKHLLMASPAGKQVTLGLDPGLRTGVKTVVVDDTGKLLEYTVIFPHAPKNQWDNSLHELAMLCKKYQVTLVSIGNGTASRETEKLVKDLIKQHQDLKLTSVVVSEAGASVYSASAFAAKEFPKLDVSYRGAVSIARRLQDPLPELVKIDPKSIGVGQYQHDVNQIKLSRSLNAVLEDCVNAVGADVNTASVPLLKSIAGLNETIAQNIIDYREANGRFSKRNQLKKVPRLGDKTFEQAIGFLRIIDGEDPLDASAVHPESYAIVEKIAKACQLSVKDLIGNVSAIDQLKTKDFTDEHCGELTIRDILNELKKPGRDPRPEFKTASFKDGIEKISDLKEGMKLEGVVSNVTNFGAFVDIGVHQDGLVHISHLADCFVSDPKDVVKAGQIVQVTVLDVDIQRNRIQLSMKGQTKQKAKPKKAKQSTAPKGAFGDALSSALKK